MPFTLAHPAAVLPFRRFDSRLFNFPALVAGSVSPDFGYCLRRLELDKFSHSFLGSFAFCLPVGLGLLALFHALSRLLHGPESRVLSPPSPHNSPVVRSLVVLLSILIGSWTHLVWDSFTNNSGWAVEHIAALQIQLLSVAGHQARVCHALWYASSFLGAMWVCLAYANSAHDSPDRQLRAQSVRVAVLAGILVLPIGAVHHLFAGLVGASLVAGLSAGLLAAVAFSCRNLNSQHSWLTRKSVGVPATLNQRRAD